MLCIQVHPGELWRLGTTKDCTRRDSVLIVASMFHGEFILCHYQFHHVYHER